MPRLNQTYRQLLNDNELLAADHKQLKSQLNEAKLEHTWLDADFCKLKKEFQQLDITSTKLTNQCEVLTTSPCYCIVFPAYLDGTIDLACFCVLRVDVLLSCSVS